MANIDWIIRQCVDDIWVEYDQDHSGSLDKDETRQLIEHTLVEMFEDDVNMDDEAFDKAFEEFDLDHSGLIEKDEMALFIRKVAGLMPE